MAMLKQLLGEVAEAEQLLRQALTAKEKVFGACHPDVAEVLEALSQLLAHLGLRADEGALLSERARAIRNFYIK